MSKRANPTVIGAFVVGAVALAVVAILVLSGGQLFSERFRYIMYFEGSVKGLAVGAPVMFRGVRIGSVTDIRIEVKPDTNEEPKIPVYIELEPERITYVGAGSKRPRPENITKAVDRGFRGQLELQSLLTGKMFIQLDFHPDKPANFVGTDKKTLEIPTIPTPIQELSKRFEDFPIEEVLEHVASISEAIDRLVNAPELMEAIVAFDDALMQVKSTLATAEASIAENSQLHHDVSAALNELSSAARSVRFLADSLERRPDSLLRGKTETKGNR